MFIISDDHYPDLRHEKTGFLQYGKIKSRISYAETALKEWSLFWAFKLLAFFFDFMSVCVRLAVVVRFNLQDWFLMMVIT